MTPAFETSDDTLLDRLQRAAFDYFPQAANPANGLIADNSRANSPVSIAVVGFALACYPVAVARGWLARADAVQRSLAALRFFRDSDQSGGPEATGYKGFYYHFLDFHTGARVWRSELSMIDTALLIAGALTANMFFDSDTAEEIELRKIVDMLFRRIDWQWAQDGGETLRQGWKPECGRPVLPRMDGNLPVGERVRLRFSVWRAAFRAPILACMDRFSRNQGSVHAREALRLFREQPARDPCPARICPAQPE